MSSKARQRGVLIVASGFDGYGGLQRLTRWIAGGLAEHGPVTVLTWSSRAWPASEQRDGYTVVRIPSLGTWGRERGPFRGMLDTVFSLVTGTVAALVLHRRYRAIYALGIVPEGLVGALVGTLLRRRSAFGVWSSGPLGNVARLRSSPFAGLERRLLFRSAAFVAESPQIGEELVAAGFEAVKVHVIESGVELGEPLPRDRSALPAELRGADGVLLAAARFDLRQKRFDLLLEGWRRAAPAGWRLVLIGDGPHRDRIAALAAALSPPAVLVGWQQDLRPFFAACDAFTLPTDAEGSGLVVLEGMAAARAGLVSCVSPFDRSRPEGVTLVANDPEAWAEALRSLTAATDLPERGAAARAWAEVHSDLRVTLEAYRQLLLYDVTGAGSATHVS